MNAELRTVDHTRAGRLVIAWLDGDRLALDVVMTDAAEDDAPGSTAGLLFAMAQLAAEVLTASTGSTQAAADTLRRSLADVTSEAIDRGEE